MDSKQSSPDPKQQTSLNQQRQLKEQQPCPKQLGQPQESPDSLNALQEETREAKAQFKARFPYLRNLDVVQNNDLFYQWKDLQDNPVTSTDIRARSFNRSIARAAVQPNYAGGNGAPQRNMAGREQQKMMRPNEDITTPGTTMANPIDVDRDIIHRPNSFPTQPTTSSPSSPSPEETVPLGTGTTDEEVDAAAALIAIVSDGKRKLSLGEKMIAKTAINYGKLRQQAHKEAAHDLWVRGVKNFGEKAMQEMWEQVRDVVGF